MDIAIFSPQELPFALGVMRALQPGTNSLRDRFVRVVARLHGVSVDPARLPTPSFAETAAAIPDPTRRKRLVQLAVVGALLGGDLAPALEDSLANLCDALGVDDAAIRAGRAMLSSNRAVWSVAVGGAVS